MAKRHLGLGKAAKTKKQKTEEVADKNEESSGGSNELTVELNEEVDADDEIAQLRALWNTHSKSEKDNELVVNGIVHECDRLLRNAKKNEEGIAEVPDYFHSVYALALADLALFHAEDKSKVHDYFEAALERIDLGLKAHPQSIDLLFAKSRILLNRIPLQFISQLTVDSVCDDKIPKIKSLLDESLKVYESAESEAVRMEKYNNFDEATLVILEALDDLLDIVDNFGKNDVEGESSDNEDDENDEIILLKKHPLYGIKESDKYNQWWRDHIINLLQYIDKELEKLNIDYKEQKEGEHPLLSVRREVCRRIGQSYLQEAEVPSTVFTTLTYDDGAEGLEELDGLTREDAQKIAQDLLATALKYLRMAEDKDEPETWVNVAEAIISLANLHELDSEEQESLYKDAEKILNKANKVTNGKYDEALENLLG